MVAIVLAAKRNVKKKTDDLIDVWQAPLPNNGKVKVTIDVEGADTDYFFDHYQTLNIDPFVEYNGNKYYLVYMGVNGEQIIGTPKLYLDKYINEIFIVYFPNGADISGLVLLGLDDISLKDYFPIVGNIPYSESFPRGQLYKGLKIGEVTDSQTLFAFPVDLYKEDFEIWNNGIKYTVRLNLDDIETVDNYTWAYFDIIKAEFYGELLPAEQIDDYIELKPKGV